MKIAVIHKNAKFKSNNSDSIIRIKEVLGDKVVVEEVYSRNKRFSAIEGSIRTINTRSVQKNYSPIYKMSKAAIQKGMKFKHKFNDDIIRVLDINDGRVIVEDIALEGREYRPIKGTQRVIGVDSVRVTYQFL